MIVVRLESWPGGDRRRRRTISTGRIVRVEASGDDGLYLIELDGDGTGGRAGREPWRRGRVANFPRARLGAWDLLFRGLAAVIADRSPGCAARAAIEAARGSRALGGVAAERLLPANPERGIE